MSWAFPGVNAGSSAWTPPKGLPWGSWGPVRWGPELQSAAPHGPSARPHVPPGPPATSGLALPLHGRGPREGTPGPARTLMEGLPSPTRACPALGSPRPHLQLRCVHQCPGLLQVMGFQGCVLGALWDPGDLERAVAVDVSSVWSCPQPSWPLILPGGVRPGPSSHGVPRCLEPPPPPRAATPARPTGPGALIPDPRGAGGGGPAGALPRWLWPVLRARPTRSGPPRCFPSAFGSWSERQTQRPPGLPGAGRAPRQSGVPAPPGARGVRSGVTRLPPWRRSVQLKS